MQYATTFVAMMVATYTNALIAAPARVSHPHPEIAAPTGYSSLAKRDDSSADLVSAKQLVDAAIEKYKIDEYLTPDEIELAQSFIFGDDAARHTSGTPTSSVSASAAATQKSSFGDMVNAAIDSFTDK